MASHGREERLKAVRAFAERIDDWLRFGEDNRIAPIMAHTYSKPTVTILHKPKRRKRSTLEASGHDILMDNLMRSLPAREELGLVAEKCRIAHEVYPRGVLSMGDLDGLIDKAVRLTDLLGNRFVQRREGAPVTDLEKVGSRRHRYPGGRR